MCLERVKKKSNFEKEYTAYKFFIKFKEELYFPLLGHNKLLPLNKWLNEKDCRCLPDQVPREFENTPYTDDFVINTNLTVKLTYPKGFHAYISDVDAHESIIKSGWSLKCINNNALLLGGEKLVVCKVLLQEIMVIGTQLNVEVIVAKRMKIIEEIK